MKKIFIILMSLCLLFSLVGCSAPFTIVGTDFSQEYELINVYQFHADYPFQNRGINYHFQYIDDNGIIKEYSIHSKSSLLSVSVGDSDTVSFGFNVYADGTKSPYISSIRLILSEKTIKSINQKE